jgi:chemotaxis protein MotB
MAKPEGEELKKRLEFSEYKRVLLQKRLSKGSIEEDSTLWSFVDLMTLLLILFILFYSHAVTKRGSAKDVASKQAQIAEAPPIEVHKTSMAIKPVAYDTDQPEPDVVKTVAENQKEAEALEQFEQQVLQTVSEKVKKDFSIHWNQKRLILVLGERIAFNVGEADLLPDFQPTLKRIAGFISSQKGYRVTVAGHTDDTPINNTQFPSNWELSAMRAVNVAKFMILHGLNPHRISTEGYSAYRPLQPNTTDDNRHANRRVEITLIKAQEDEKSAEEKISVSTPDVSIKPTPAANLPTYPKRRYHTARDYPF